MSDQDYTAILLEELRDQNKAILEFVGEIPAIKQVILSAAYRGLKLLSFLQSISMSE
jgi:hypothetical protein